MTIPPVDRRVSRPDVPQADPAIAARTWVVVPAFRECAAIGAVVQPLCDAGWRVVVVDDGSNDGTGEAARAAGAWVLTHPVNIGQGAALRTGFQFALESPETKYVITFDADGQHDHGALMRLIAPVASDTVDIALGSRFLASDGPPPGIPPLRRALLRAATRVGRWTTGLALTDTHNGMRAFRRGALQRMILEQDRMAHASEILTQVAQLRLRYCEVPVRVTYTAYSLAKGQRMIDAVSVLWDLLIVKAR